MLYVLGNLLIICCIIHDSDIVLLVNCRLDLVISAWFMNIIGVSFNCHVRLVHSDSALVT